MKCADCPYYYKDIEFEDGESYEVSNAYCHYYWQDDDAPCEDTYYEEEVNEN